MTAILMAMVMILTAETIKPVETSSYSYSMVAEIVAVDKRTDEVTCVDSNGFEWVFYGIEDYWISDLVILEMDDCGTKNIFDDVIINTYYSGYTSHSF